MIFFSLCGYLWLHSRQQANIFSAMLPEGFVKISNFHFNRLLSHLNNLLLLFQNSQVSYAIFSVPWKLLLTFSYLFLSFLSTSQLAFLFDFPHIPTSGNLCLGKLAQFHGAHCQRKSICTVRNLQGLLKSITFPPLLFSLHYFFLFLHLATPISLLIAIWAPPSISFHTAQQDKHHHHLIRFSCDLTRLSWTRCHHLSHAGLNWVLWSVLPCTVLD